MASSQFVATSYRSFKSDTGYSTLYTGLYDVITQNFDKFRHSYRGLAFFNAAAIAAAKVNKVIDQVEIRLTPINEGRYNTSAEWWFWITNITAMPSDAYNFLGGLETDQVGTKMLQRLTKATFTKAGGQQTGVIATGATAQALVDSLAAGNALGLLNWVMDGITATTGENGGIHHGGTTTAPILIITYHDATTKCTPPESAELEASLAEAPVPCTFSGAGAGVANDITGYEFQYAESTDGSTWGSWTALKTITLAATGGSTELALSGTRGNYRKYRMRTRGEAGSSYYSDWKTITGTVRKNSAPTAPTSLAATPPLREGEAVSLSYAGQTDPDGNIDHFEFEYCVMPAGGSYGSWTNLGTDAASPYSHTPELPDGSRIKYRIKAVDAFGVASGWKISNEVVQNSAPTAPTTLAATPSLRESGAVDLAYSGQADVDGNIDHFVFEYSIRLSGGSYGAWLTLGTDTASPYSTTPSLSDGDRIKYRVKAVDALGVASAWKESNEIVQNSAPTGMTSLAATPTLRESGAVTLAYSGQTDPDNNIDHLEFEYCVMPAGGIYGAWMALGTDTASPYSHTPSLSDGDRIKYRGRAVDALGVESEWCESNEVIQNSAPLTPVIAFPGAGKTTYNNQPYVGLTIGAEPDGQVQTLYFSVDGGAEQNAGAALAGTKKLKLPAMAAGNHVLRFFLKDSQGAASGTATVTVTVAENAYDRAITGYVSAQQPGAKLWDEANGWRTSVEMLELKARVNQVRAYYGMEAISLPYEGATGTDSIKHFHTWTDNMAALYQGMADTGAVSGAEAPDRVVRERNAPSAGVVNQVRGMIGNM